MFGGVFDPPKLAAEIETLENETLAPSFWDDRGGAEAHFNRLSVLKETLNPWRDLIASIDELGELLELYSGEDDPSIIGEVEQQIGALDKTFQALRLKILLSGKHDRDDCFLTIHAGAGGTEACDWAQMLMRMYIRYCEGNDYKVNIVDLLEAEGGVKSATLQITGPYAYGYLQGETGVHRLVRISPFDSNKRRHTSFTSIYVTPDIDNDIEVEIDPSDLRIDTYRSGGAGGQHVNKTDSAVRITHLKTGIVVACQNERSQHINKALAMKVLKSRLYEYYRLEQAEQQAKEAKEKREISWGNQIRSYVFQPYTMVKDHRTNFQMGNIQAVMDGEITPFIEAFLRWQAER